jgi:hypothetical protein
MANPSAAQVNFKIRCLDAGQERVPWREPAFWVVIGPRQKNDCFCAIAEAWVECLLNLSTLVSFHFYGNLFPKQCGHTEGFLW